MKRAVQLVLVLAAAGIAIWLWTVLNPSPEKVVRSRLNALAKAISFKPGASTIGKAYNAQKAGDF